MGALHAGHGRLIERSSKENALTVVSIFVNPKQFGANEDLAKYPRTFEADCQLCEKAGAQLVFAPTPDEMYPSGFRTTVNVSELDQSLCGAYRPGHFSGVCTVVLLLLNLVSPDKAYFGLKDFQQFTIISRMVQDLAHPVTLVGVPTVRESDGLAMSSRNRYLDGQGRQIARCIPQALRAVASSYLSGVVDADVLLSTARESLSNVPGFDLQYCELRDVLNLTPSQGHLSSATVMAVAGFVDSADGTRTRLIDNIVLTREPGQLEDLFDFVRLTAHSS